jgi:hypothetical protein
MQETRTHLGAASGFKTRRTNRSQCNAGSREQGKDSVRHQILHDEFSSSLFSFFASHALYDVERGCNMLEDASDQQIFCRNAFLASLLQLQS